MSMKISMTQISYISEVTHMVFLCSPIPRHENSLGTLEWEF